MQYGENEGESSAARLRRVQKDCLASQQATCLRHTRTSILDLLASTRLLTQAIIDVLATTSVRTSFPSFCARGMRLFFLPQMQTYTLVCGTGSDSSTCGLSSETQNAVSIRG